jgi:hypothetical protein
VTDGAKASFDLSKKVSNSKEIRTDSFQGYTSELVC